MPRPLYTWEGLIRKGAPPPIHIGRFDKEGCPAPYIIGRFDKEDCKEQRNPTPAGPSTPGGTPAGPSAPAGSGLEPAAAADAPGSRGAVARTPCPAAAVGRGVACNRLPCAVVPGEHGSAWPCHVHVRCRATFGAGRRYRSRYISLSSPPRHIPSCYAGVCTSTMTRSSAQQHDDTQ